MVVIFMKKILLAGIIVVVFIFSNAVPAYSFQKQKTTLQGHIEHLTNKQDSKANIVRITKDGRIIQKENVLEIAFSENFDSKYYIDGDMVQFTFTNDVITDEGTLIIPKNSNLIGAIDKIQKPKWFSRNAKVTLDFMYILLPNGKRLDIYMELANGKGYLAAGAKDTAKKITAYTLGTGSVGAGLGAAIGTASSNTIPGLIIGGSIGGGVGLVSGIVSPGLHYKAKKGYLIPVRLQDNLSVPNL